VIAPLLNIILAGVPPRDAGSASGVLTTFQQLGGAVGVAVVGVVFFGLLSSRASVSLDAVTPHLRALLAAAHLPPAQVTQQVSHFRHCFEVQAASSDPTVPVPGCPSLSSSAPANPVGAAFAGAAKSALAQDFVSSFERILFFNVGFWVLTGASSMLLPRARQPGPQPAASGAH
jgi:hypothetical protein